LDDNKWTCVDSNGVLTRKEREELVIDLNFNQNKTYHEIAKIARISPRDIKPIIDKAYQEKERQEQGCYHTKSRTGSDNPIPCRISESKWA
jgi:hypothetical protein